jgi:hypothetical protein
MRESDFQTWKHDAVDEAKVLNEQCMREFRLGSWPRWETNLEQGRFYFVENGIPRVAASVVVVGSYSTKSETWLWSWANEHLPSTAKDGIEVVRDWGTREGVRALTEAKFPADEGARVGTGVRGAPVVKCYLHLSLSVLVRFCLGSVQGTQLFAGGRPRKGNCGRCQGEDSLR